MAMMQEEVRFRLGIDSSAVTQGLRDMRAKVSNFANKSSKQFKSMQEGVRAVALQIPFLGTAFEALASPVGLAIGGIVGGLALWSKRMKEMKATFTEFVVPQLFSKGGQERVDATKDSWDKYNKTLETTIEKLRGIEGQHGATMGAIQRRFDIMEKLTGGNPTMSKRKAQEELEANRALANELSTQSMRGQMMARVLSDQTKGTLLSMNPKQKAEYLNNLRDTLAGAEAEIKNRQQRIQDIENAVNSGPLNVKQRFTFKARYGNTMTSAEARAIERQMMDSAMLRRDIAQSQLERVESGGRGGELKKRIDELLTQSAKDASKSMEMRGKNKDAFLQLQLEHAIERLRAGKFLVPSTTGFGETTHVDAVNMIRRAGIDVGFANLSAEMQEAALARLGLGAGSIRGGNPQERTANVVEELLGLAKDSGLVIVPRSD